jgi:hypothetical protein
MADHRLGRGSFPVHGGVHNSYSDFDGSSRTADTLGNQGLDRDVWMVFEEKQVILEDLFLSDAAASQTGTVTDKSKNI